MVTATLDIDCDSPYPLAKELFTMANYDCVIRLSATKGTHLKIFGLSASEAFSIRTRLDDSYRVQLDTIRYRHDKNLCTNVLWDKKCNKKAGIWLQWSTHSLAFWLLQDTGYSLRDAITNLFNVMVLREFSDVLVGVIDRQHKHKWFQITQYEQECEVCKVRRDWTI